MAAAYLTPPSPRRRALSVALTIAVHVLLVWALLNLGPPREFTPFAPSGSLTTFTVAPEAQAPRRERAVTQQLTRPRSAAPPPPAPKPPIAFKDTSGVIWMTREQFAATDVSKSGSLPARGRAGDAQLAESGADTDDDTPSTLGPNGQRLYAAEWYREPTDAELRTFLPPAQPDSWGRIYCRMVPDYRVEDCRTMGESPRGSGIATGVRRAAWQFRVRPPRVGGQPRYGTWVAIVITFSPRGPEAR